MPFRISGQDHGQRAVPGDIACSAKTVLKRKDSKHERSTCGIKSKDSRDQSERRHDRTARNARRADGKYAEKKAEQDIVPGDGIIP